MGSPVDNPINYDYVAHSANDKVGAMLQAREWTQKYSTQSIPEPSLRKLPTRIEKV